MKLLGSLVVILSLTFIGRVHSNKISKRVEYIKMMMDVLEYIKNEILYNMISLFELSNKLSKNLYFRKLNIFNNLYKDLLNNKSVNEAWNKSITNSVIFDILDKCEIDEIFKIGNRLGDGSLDGQISNINLTSQYLKLKLDQAQKDKEKYYKIYNNLGILLGIATVILIW